MDTWQIVTLAVLVLAPLVLLGVFHGARERLSARGRPLGRSWRPAVQPLVVEDDHH